MSRDNRRLGRRGTPGPFLMDGLLTPATSMKGLIVRNRRATATNSRVPMPDKSAAAFARGERMTIEKPKILVSLRPVLASWVSDEIWPAGWRAPTLKPY